MTDLGVRVAKTIVASGEDHRFLSMLRFLLATRPQQRFKAWLLGRTSGVNPKYRKYNAENQTYLLLTPWLSPLWNCLRSACQLLRPHNAYTYFDLVPYFFQMWTRRSGPDFCSVFCCLLLQSFIGRYSLDLFHGLCFCSNLQIRTSWDTGIGSSSSSVAKTYVAWENVP